MEEQLPAEVTNKSDETRFSLDKSLDAGWHKCWKYFWPFTGVLTTTFLLGALPTAFSLYVMYVNSSPTLIAISMLVGICGAVMQDLFQLGYTNLQLRALDGKTIVTRDVFVCTPLLLKYIIASLLYKIMVMAGYICFIVPGVIFQVKFQFFGYFIVEYNMGPIKALKASSKLTEGIKMDLTILALVQFVITSVGSMCLMVGSFPAWLINTIATASTYRQLLKSRPITDAPSTLLETQDSGVIVPLSIDAAS